MMAQMKIIGNQGTDRTGSINDADKSKAITNKSALKQRRTPMHVTKECGNCGHVYDITKKEQCPAYLKECRKCGKCRSNKKQIAPKIRAADDKSKGEVFSILICELEYGGSEFQGGKGFCCDLLLGRQARSQDFSWGVRTSRTGTK